MRFPGGLALGDVAQPDAADRPLPHRPRAAGAAAPWSGSAPPPAAASSARGYRALGRDEARHRPLRDRVLAPDGPRLDSVHPGVTVESVVAATGFALAVDDAVETPPPSDGRARRRSTPSTRTGGATSRSGVVVTPQPKGAPMPEMRLDHISFLVADLDAAIEKWKRMLGILDPKQAERITYGEGVEGGEHMKLGDVRQPRRLRDPALRAGPDGLPEEDPREARRARAPRRVPLLGRRRDRRRSCARPTSRSCRRRTRRPTRCRG